LFSELNLHDTLDTLLIDIPDLINALFCAAAVMITFGVIIGKVTPLQLVILTTIEVMFFAANTWVCIDIYHAVDIGGSMVIHAFGGYFGVVTSLICTRAHQKDNPKAGSTITTDIFAMIGTLFLWLCWPSFNSALAPAANQQRTIINTYFSIIGSCLVAWLTSFIFRGGKFSMIDVQNATLAGGVGVGSAADLVITPGGALGVGFAAGFLSAFGFNVIQPLLLKYLRFHDTCGVHNLHAMPGVYAGVVSIISTALYYNNAFVSDFFYWGGYQPLIQMACLGTSVGFGVAGGAITGTILRFLPYPKEDFDDKEFWIVEEEEEHHSK